MADVALEGRWIGAKEAQIRDVTAWDRLKANRKWLGFWFMLPAAAFLVLFLAYPLGPRRVAFVHRCPHRPQSENSSASRTTNGCGATAMFWLSVFNTLLYTCVASALKFAVGLYLALLLNQHMPFKAIIRAVVLIPFIVPTVLSAIAFWWIYDSQFSIVSWTLKKAGFISENIDFLGDFWNARWSVIFANIWRGVPFVAITLLAGLQTVSPSLYEAATIDGATPLADIPPHYLPAADSDHCRGHDVLGALHVHRLPAHLGADARRPRQCHAPDGDARLPARHRRRLSGRRRGDLPPP